MASSWPAHARSGASLSKCNFVTRAPASVKKGIILRLVPFFFWATGSPGEIAADPALRWFGAALGVGHVLTAAFWLHSRLELTLAPGSEAICWPFLPDCHLWH